MTLPGLLQSLFPQPDMGFFLLQAGRNRQTPGVSPRRCRDLLAPRSHSHVSSRHQLMPSSDTISWLGEGKQHRARGTPSQNQGKQGWSSHSTIPGGAAKEKEEEAVSRIQIKTAQEESTHPEHKGLPTCQTSLRSLNFAAAPYRQADLQAPSFSAQPRAKLGS